MQTKKPRRRQIKNLAVDRVDAVDSPATGMKFLLFKSDDPAVLREQASLLVTAVGGLLDAIAADTVFRAGEDTLAQLGTLAKMLDREPLAVSADAAEAAETEPEASVTGDPEAPLAQEAASEDGDGAESVEAGEADSDTDGDEDDSLGVSAPSIDLDQLVAALAAALEKPAARMEAAVRALEKRIAALDTDGSLKKPRKIIVRQQPSRQPAGQDEPIAKSRANGAAPELGKGLFRNIVFGQ